MPHKTPPSPEPGEHNLYLGEKVDFEVERAYKSQPKLRRYGIVAKYKLKVNSPELEKIRRELTGLAPPKTGFYITLAILIEEIVGPYTDLEDGKNENSLTQKIKEEVLDDEKKRKKGKSEADKSSEDKKSQKKKDDESTDDEKKRKKGKSETEKSSEELGRFLREIKEKKQKIKAEKSSEDKKPKKEKDDESTDDEEDEKVKNKFDDEEEVINKNLLIASIAVNSLTIIVLGFIINSE